MTYSHELPSWPQFEWKQDRLTNQLAQVRHRQGHLLGQMQALGFSSQSEAALQTLTSDVLNTSEIEGEHLDAPTVRSSVARHLGLDIGALKPKDRHVEGIVEVMLDATRHFSRPLTAKRLFAWQAALFPTGQRGFHKIATGAWRKDSTGPMQVISGPLGKEKVHFEAPAAQRLKIEMPQFLEWFNAAATTDPVLKAAQAHLWFVTVHPFEDGNGRIARAIADMALARSEFTPERFYSMSTQIQEERAAYYRILETTQKSPTLDITPWMEWFLACLGRAIERSHTALAGVRQRATFWQSTATVPINGRQRQILNRLLNGFEGKLTTSKYAQLTKCSQDTALRDIQALAQQGVLLRNSEGGRSTTYALAEIIPQSLFTRA